MAHASRYAQKTRTNGRDNYGSWNNGIQQVADKINGHTLTYNHKTGDWR